MSRVQLALNVPDLAEALDFYAKLLGTEPAKVRPGYANFAVADPPVKLVLIENPGAEPGSLNHLGVEVETAGNVATTVQRLAGAGLRVTSPHVERCCYAVQDKAWVHGPGGAEWEIYAVLSDAGMPDVEIGPEREVACCADPACR